MKYIRTMICVLALTLVLTGMAGAAYAENGAENLSDENTDSPPAFSSYPPEAEEEGAEWEPDVSEAPFGEEMPVRGAADEPTEEPTEETTEAPAANTVTPEAEPAAEEPATPGYTSVEPQTGETLTQVSVAWSTGAVQFIVSDVQRWNAEELCWETDPDRNGEITLAEGSNRKIFTVTNGSDEVLTADVAFTPNESLPEALQQAYDDISLTCESIPAGETVTGLVTVRFDFSDVRLTDETVTGGLLGTITLYLTPEAGYEETEEEE